ncbi:class II fructose-bisphosphate aldolase [Patescibacteria group bacterium]|nr:class II fructose-bisphosphate aldolase [Patescibacteria group bacterium]
MRSKKESLKYFLQKAKRGKWAIGQFNFSTSEQLKAIISAAEKAKAPVILGTSGGEVKFFGLKKAIILRNYYRKIFPYIYLNLDHGRDIALIKKAIDMGYDCVHFDGGDLSLKQNIETAKKIVQYAHQRGVLVEGEIKSIKGSSETHKKKFKAKESFYEDIEKAKKFVQATGVDSLAINIGNVHGTYKNKIRLNIDLLKKINKELNVFLVLHGGSGTNDNDIKKAIKNGVVKININTELREVWKKSMLKHLKKQTIKPYKILPFVIKDIQDKVEEKIKLSGTNC